MNALTFMQTLFYGDSPVRKLLPATIYPKEYGHGQFEREENIWPSVIASGLEMHLVFMIGLLPDPTTMQWFSWRSVGIMLATHALPVELIYYWGHRWMHDFPSLYKVHKHHHLSTVATPKTSVTFLWSEHLFYDLLFALPILVPTFMGEASLAVTLFYIPVFDVINSLGHTNLELFPSWYLESPLYYLFYCPTYHHVHHKYFKYNYALFMPIYDVIFGTYSKKFTEQDFRAAKKRLHSR
jgi:sterol desaturase/sphingolipid hydroxylase (fatty acid hydroxylase superfamily)